MSLAPSRLEHAHAFDLAAARLGETGDTSQESLLALVSTPEFVDLSLARAWGAVTFLCEDETTLAHARHRLSEGYLSETALLESRATLAGGVRRAGSDLEPPGQFGAAIWAAPQPASYRGRLTELGQLVRDGGTLCILTATRIGGVLKPLRAAAAAGEPLPLQRQLRARLPAVGWRLETEREIGGIAGAAWAVLGRIATAVGRPDLADRAERAHHLAVGSHRLASYALLTAVRNGREHSR